MQSQNCEKWLLALSCLSVHPHGTTWLPLDGFSWNLILEDFLKICWENSSFINIRQEYWVLYMKTLHFRSYLAQFFLEWKIFQTKVVEKLETHILSLITFFGKSCHLWDNVEKFCRAEHPRMKIWCMHISCWILKATKCTHRLCNTHCFSTVTVVAWTHLNVMLYVNCLSC